MTDKEKLDEFLKEVIGIEVDLTEYQMSLLLMTMKNQGEVYIQVPRKI